MSTSNRVTILLLLALILAWAMASCTAPPMARLPDGTIITGGETTIFTKSTATATETKIDLPTGHQIAFTHVTKGKDETVVPGKAATSITTAKLVDGVTDLATIDANKATSLAKENTNLEAVKGTNAVNLQNANNAVPLAETAAQQ